MVWFSPFFKIFNQQYAEITKLNRNIDSLNRNYSAVGIPQEIALEVWNIKSSANLEKLELFIKHNDTASSYQQCTHNDFSVYRFFQEHERQADGDYHTEFVNGCNTGYITQLQGSEIKEPWQTSGCSWED